MPVVMPLKFDTDNWIGPYSNVEPVDAVKSLSTSETKDHVLPSAFDKGKTLGELLKSYHPSLVKHSTFVKGDLS